MLLSVSQRWELFSALLPECVWRTEMVAVTVLRNVLIGMKLLLKTNKEMI